MPKTFECVLQGEVAIQDYPLFLERIQGLLNDSAHQESFAYTEYSFSFDDQCPHFVEGVPFTDMRAREILCGSSLFTGEAVEPSLPTDARWELRYIGKWERRAVDQKHVVPHRNHISVSCSANVREYLTTLGFRPKFRYVRGGTRWQIPNGVLIEATKIKALESGEEAMTAKALDQSDVDAMLLEIRAIATAEKIAVVSSQLLRLASDLNPFFIPRPLATKEINISTATLAAESRKRKA